MKRVLRFMTAKTFMFAIAFITAGLVHGLPGYGAASSPGPNTRFSLSGGVASPAPGLGLEISGAYDLSQQSAVGLRLSAVRANAGESGSRQDLRAHDVFYERSLAFLDGYYFIRGRLFAGVVHIDERLSASEVAGTGRPATRKVWAPDFGGEVLLDVPLADLVWLRSSVWSSRAIVAGSLMLGGVSVGLVFGGGWLGIGD